MARAHQGRKRRARDQVVVHKLGRRFGGKPFEGGCSPRGRQMTLLIAEVL